MCVRDKLFFELIDITTQASSYSLRFSCFHFHFSLSAVHDFLWRNNLALYFFVVHGFFITKEANNQYLFHCLIKDNLLIGCKVCTRKWLFVREEYINFFQLTFSFVSFSVVIWGFFGLLSLFSCYVLNKSLIFIEEKMKNDNLK